ncbi:Lysylphosphatidylglycerol synthase TM region [uncultured archaeon]|nr:Lysylphosphatidylglycerol synthase TM region [uncultured archaeon]
MERFKQRDIWIVILIGIAIYALFIRMIGIDRFLILMSYVNKFLVLLVVLFNLLNLTAFTLTWRFLISAPVSSYKLFKFYMIGTFINNITPTLGVGGEPVKAILLGKETGTSQAGCFATVVSQRMLNMFPFMTIGGLGITLLFYKPGIVLKTWEILALLFSIGFAFGIFGLIVYFYIRKDKLSLFVHSSIRFFAPFIGLVKKGFNQEEYAEAMERSINSFHGGLAHIHHNRYGLAKATLFAFLGWIFDIMSIYSVFLSLGSTEYIHISVLIITYTVSMISSWLPFFLPAGLGIVDSIMALLFVYGGVPVETAIIATLLYRLLSYWSNTVLGGYFLLTYLRSNPAGI